MTEREIALRAMALWSIYPALALPMGVYARRRGQGDFLPRALLWLVIVPLFLGSAYLGPPVFHALLIGCCLIACCEISALGATQKPLARRALHFVVSAGLALPWLAAAWWIPPGEGLPLAGMATLAPPVLMWQSLRRKNPWPLPLLATLLGMGLACWGVLDKHSGGFRYVLFAFSAVALHDMTAYAGGRFLSGWHPFPRLSPGKTLSGLLVGAACCLLATHIFWFAVPELSPLQINAAGALLAVSALGGDLLASAVKRHYGIKDFGKALGPMGGMMDRCDSLLFSAWAMLMLMGGVG
jgi:phosphatidate cytidylyltransferase